jgi:hypothetical protein
MTAESSPLVRSWPVGPWVATLTVGPLKDGRPTALLIEWGPTKPAFLTKAQVAQYRHGRDKALRELSALTGCRLAVLDV